MLFQHTEGFDKKKLLFFYSIISSLLHTCYSHILKHTEKNNNFGPEKCFYVLPQAPEQIPHDKNKVQKLKNWILVIFFFVYKNIFQLFLLDCFFPLRDHREGAGTSPTCRQTWGKTLDKSPAHPRPYLSIWGTLLRGTLAVICQYTFQAHHLFLYESGLEIFKRCYVVG